jgi:N-methylhydantoinase A
MRVGIEVGGTFTDLVAIDGGRVTVLKVPSTPRSPDIGAFAALAESGIPIASITELAHGSTVATNAVLERKGFPTAFVTTAGFRDLLALQRHGRSRIYDLAYHQPPAVVDRRASFEVTERVLADGTVLTPLDLEAAGRMLVPALASGGYRAVAICLLNAYINPAHEQALKALIRERLPAVHVTVSTDVTREFREFERASTVTLSAYVQPVMDGYIARFGERLAQAGFAGRFSVMQSNGGRVPGEAMRENAVTALLSGPAAGVTGAARQAGRSGFGNLITLDIGGTSTDVCVVTGGRPQLTNEFTIDGLPVRIPVIDINTVGAGGGSIIWVDEGGMLRVGPRSAGADPGPACYGRGGQAPTITDAHVVRRTMRADAFLGGRMRIDEAAAHAAMATIADRFGMRVEEAADAAIRIATANIVRAIQLISTERGHDPRDYALVPYGGAGPLHAADVARDLGIGTIVVPPSAGIISAYGLIASDMAQFDSLTLRAAVDDAAPGIVRDTFVRMRDRAIARARSFGLDGEPLLEFTADMRFVGQAFEVPVKLPADALDDLTEAALRARFGEAHQKVYQFGADSDRPVEIVAFRLGLVLPLDAVPMLAAPAGALAEARRIELFTDRAWHTGHLVSRGALVPGQQLAGPALLDDATSTLYVPAGWRARQDDAENLILTRENADA